MTTTAEWIDVGLGIQEVRFPGWTPPHDVMVSVCVQTYQHGPYIAKCLEQICAQKTSFEIEILVGEDASTDGTRETCLEWAARHPQRIRLLLHDRSNVIRIQGVATGRFNGMTNLGRARGKYIAFCEGDDYWADCDKLQQQVDLLESHPEHMFAFHDAIEVDESGRESGRRLLGPRLCRDRPRERVIAGDGMPTASVMFRRELLDRLPTGFRQVMNADTYLFCFGGQFGSAGYVDVQPSRYRVHSQGIWSVRSQLFRLRSNLHTFQTLLPDMQREYRGIVAYQICRGYNRIIGRLATQGRLIEAAKWTAGYLGYAATRFGVRAAWYQARWFLSLLRNLVVGRSRRQAARRAVYGVSEPVAEQR